MSAEARLLQRLVAELRDIDEAYWTHRLFILVDEADALLGDKSDLPVYGESVDAALALLPPHTLWATGAMEDGPFARLCWPQQDGTYLGGYIEARAATPALSLAKAAREAWAAAPMGPAS